MRSKWSLSSKKHKPKRRQKTKYNVYQNKQKQTTKHSKTKKQNKQAKSIDNIYIFIMKLPLYIGGANRRGVGGASNYSY